MTTIKLIKTLHDQAGFELRDISADIMNLVAGLVCDNRMNSENYKKKGDTRPYLQGRNERSGWLLVEFWGGKTEDHQAYIDYLNEQLKINNLLKG